MSYYDTESPESLEFQRLYSKLKHLVRDSLHQNLIVTSSTMGEGKSTTSSLLAVTIARIQQNKTLLIDFDLRNPKIHYLFDLKREHGVGEILERKMQAKHCFKKTPFENLKVLTAGNLTLPYADVFNSATLKRFFDEIHFYYNTIIIDTAPVIPVSDALIIGAEVNGVIFVVRAGRTRRDVAKRACNLMTDAGVNILGIVVNDVEGVLPFYYSYDYYGYNYSGEKGK